MPWSTLSDAPIDSRLTPHVSATSRFRLRVCEGAASPQVRRVSVNSPRFHQVLATNSCCRQAILPVQTLIVLVVASLAEPYKLMNVCSRLRVSMDEASQSAEIARTRHTRAPLPCGSEGA